MFDYLKKLGRSLKNSDGANGRQSGQKISKSLPKNIAAMREVFCEDSDFIVREFEMPLSGGIKAALFFIDGLVSIDTVNESILRPLILESRRFALAPPEIKSAADICNTLLPSGETGIQTGIDEALDACLAGDTVLMLDGFAEFVYINTKGFEKRAVTEPQTETVIRGPREGFTEVLRTNTSLIRRKLKSPGLRMDMMKIGSRTQTSVCLVYLEDVASGDLVAEVKKRLATIDTDSILSSGYIEEFIEDSPYSLFQTIYYTEKPDIVVAKLLEGRCALVIDGTPFVLTMPMLFIESFQSPEDYAIRPFIAVFLRIIRIFAFFISLISPAMYVALTSFHQELIPTTLLFTIAASSEGVPFNSFVETAIMLVTFEVIKEAGVRLPRPVGQAVSIVGALVMGQAAIQAGIVGAPVVIVIAFTAVSSFLIPTASDAITILRWYLLLLSALIGGFGIALGLMTILMHLASLESFGTDYLYPFSPLNTADMKDAVLRLPLWKMHTRPAAFSPKNTVRQNAPKPEFGRDDDNEPPRSKPRDSS